MRVGIDLDGVCYDFAHSLRMYLDSLGGLPDYPDPVRWEFYEDWGLDLTGFLQLCHDGVDAGVIFSYGEPHPGTAEAFAKIKAAGHTIHIVTDRSFGKAGASEGATRAWLDIHELPFDSLTFSADKTVVNLDYMVDDKPENYAALKAAGVQVYLMDRPWNHHVIGAARVYTLNQFAEVIG